MNRKMTMLLSVLAALLLVAAAACGEGSMPQVGSMITLGHYEQDNDLTNGQEPIEWRVLNIEGDTVLLVSRYALDAQPYN